LVGKVLEIDERTRFRHDYVRARIACRDITKVPRTAESSLGLAVHDFHFEREVEVEGPERTLQSGIKITEGGHPPPQKKFKTDENISNNTHGDKNGKSSGKTMQLGKEKAGENRQSSNITMSHRRKLAQSLYLENPLICKSHLWRMIKVGKCTFLTHLRTLSLTVKL